MAITKIDANSFDLTDDYAFTGTISGAGGLVKLANINHSGASTFSIDGYFSSTYDLYKLHFWAGEATTNTHLKMRVNQGGTAQTGSSYYYAIQGSKRYSSSDLAQHTGGWGQDHGIITWNGVGESTHDGAVIIDITIPNPLGTTYDKGWHQLFSTFDGSSYSTHTAQCLYANNSAISGFTIFSSNSSNFILTGALYGVAT